MLYTTIAKTIFEVTFFFFNVLKSRSFIQAEVRIIYWKPVFRNASGYSGLPCKISTHAPDPTYCFLGLLQVTS